MGFEEISKFEWGGNWPTCEFSMFSMDALMALREESEPITLMSIPAGS